MINDDSSDFFSFRALLDDILRTLPEEPDNWDWANILNDHAISANAYAVRCMLTGDPKEAVWALRRAYEAADQIAIKLMNIDTNQAGAEQLLLESSYVQQELGRQERDVILLRSGTRAFIDRRSNDSMDEECLVIVVASP